MKATLLVLSLITGQMHVETGMTKAECYRQRDMVLFMPQSEATRALLNKANADGLILPDGTLVEAANILRLSAMVGERFVVTCIERQ